MPELNATFPREQTVNLVMDTAKWARLRFENWRKRRLRLHTIPVVVLSLPETQEVRVFVGDYAPAAPEVGSVLFEVIELKATGSGARIIWRTDSFLTCTLGYRDHGAVEWQLGVTEFGFRKEHEGAILGPLVEGNTYDWQAQGVDTEGRTHVSQTFMFTVQNGEPIPIRP